MSNQDTQYDYEGPLHGISSVDDPRYSTITWYSLPEVFFLVLAASVSACNSAIQMATFGEEKLDWLRQYYPYKHGTPSHDTINRLLAIIDSDQFEKWFISWVADKFELKASDLLAIDGKRLASSANRMKQMKSRKDGGDYAKIVVNCFAVASGIALGQAAVDSKSGESKGAVQLIDSLDVKGKCISGDANFCNFDLLELITSRGADYLVALKGRNGKLLTAAKDVFGDEHADKDEYQTTETGHGREECRTYRLVNTAQLDDTITSSYSMLASVVEVKRERRETRKDADFSTEIHYYVTSLDKGLEEIATKIRQHWAVENSLHHVLDVTFDEDASRMRKGNAATNLSLIRKVAMNYLMPGKSKAGIKKARMRAAFSDKRRSELFRI